jgi:hypothetical protein
MTIATINRFVSLFADAFKALSAEAPIAEIERLAMLIHHSMDNGRRAYHTSAHVFEMCEGGNPRQVLASLFHDVVYYQLDGGFPRRAEEILKKVVRVEKDGVVLGPIEAGDTGLASCTTLFGFKPGQTLPLFGGMNEFLSAVVATRFLQRYLTTNDLIAIVACIEATVPFRGKDAKGRSPFDVLGERLREVHKSLGTGAADSEIESVLSDAVALANRDVSSFSEADPATFLSATWLLIEESNAPLRAVGIYSIQEYRGALGRMEKFLSTLNPVTIFHQHGGTPSDGHFALLCESARRNLAFATDYLGAKLLSIAVAEALALATGGDCPVSMLLGDIRSAYGTPDRVEDFLPPARTAGDADLQLLKVLEKGRTKESTSDLTESPLTAFICRSLGRDRTKTALQSAKQMFAGELKPDGFLDALDPDMVHAVEMGAAQIAISRKDALLALAKAH